MTITKLAPMSCKRCNSIRIDSSGKSHKCRDCGSNAIQKPSSGAKKADREAKQEKRTWAAWAAPKP